MDDSFLYIGLDISDDSGFDSVIPIPFDADGNGSACSGSPDDPLAESYEYSVIACADYGDYEPRNTVAANMARALAEFRVLTSIDSTEASNPLPLRLQIQSPGGDGAFREELRRRILTFPTADGLLPNESQNPNPTNRTQDCIDRELALCPPAGATNRNNVEMVILAVETSGVFGPEPWPFDLTQESERERARRNRLAIAQNIVYVKGGNVIDLPPEEIAAVASRQTIPDLDVTKEVRCWEPGAPVPANPEDDAGSFAKSVDILPGDGGMQPGSIVEFQITIRNRGNEDLDVTVQDVLSEMSATAASVDCEPIWHPQAFPLQAWLTRPRDSIVNEAINQFNADDRDLRADFFFDPTLLEPGFIDAVRKGASGESEILGTLQGAVVQRQVDNSCLITEGDTLVIRFKARVDVTDDDEFCANRIDPDCVNTVSVTATYVGEAEVVATDSDTAEVNVLCRDIRFIKEADPTVVALEGGFPQVVTYTYTATNQGELTEQVEICDYDLCADLAAVAGVDPVSGQCPVCDTPGADGVPNCHVLGEVPPFPAAGNSVSTTCQISFSNRAAAEAFLARDDARTAQPGDPEECDVSPDVRDRCHTNRAEVTVIGADLDPGCNSDDTFVACETVCPGCLLEVTKTVKCTDPDTGQATAFGPVQNAKEVTLPGERLRFEISAESMASPIELVCISDTLSCRQTWSPTPLTCKIVRSGGSEEPFSGFPIDGSRICAPVNPPLQKGDKILCEFDVTAPTSEIERGTAVDCRNEVAFDGYLSDDIPNPPPGEEDCQDADPVEIDVQIRDLVYDKTIEVRRESQTGTIVNPLSIPTGPPAGMAGTPYPIYITYTYTTTNSGELEETGVISDPDLCGDVPSERRASCDVCPNPYSVDLQPGQTANARCTVRFDNPAQLSEFLRIDDAREGLNVPEECTEDSRSFCYRNRSNLSIVSSFVWPQPPREPVTAECYQPYSSDDCTTACATCWLDVNKQVACVDRDTGNTSPYGGGVTSLPGQTMRFSIDATNRGAADIAQVCIADVLSCRSTWSPTTVKCHIERFSGGIDSFPGFPIEGTRVCTPIDPPLGPGDTILCTFDVTAPASGFPANSPTDCTNTVDVDGYLPGGMANPPPTSPSDCEDSEDATINVLIRNISFEKKVSATDVAGTKLEALSLPIDPVVYPIKVTFKYEATNNGEPTEAVTIRDDQLCLDKDIPGVITGTCDVCPSPPGKTGDVPAGEKLAAECELTFASPESLAAFLRADDNNTIPDNEPPVCVGHEGECPKEQTGQACYRNRSGMVVTAAIGVDMYCNDTESCLECAEICAPCDLHVVKKVKCADDPDTQYFDSKVAVPGERLTFRFAVTDSGVPVDRLCIRDTLSCRSGWSPTSPQCTILRASGVTEPYPAPPLDSRRVCTLLSEPLGLGDQLVCTFDVTVPGQFSTAGVDVDCTNIVNVEGYIEAETPITSPSDCEDNDSAEVDVKVANIDCIQKTAEAIGISAAPSESLDLRSNTANLFPLTIRYVVTAQVPSGSSDVPFDDVSICDDNLVNAAIQAIADGVAMSIPSCQFTVPNGMKYCAEFGTVAVGPPPFSAACEFQFETPEAWKAFACYVSTVDDASRMACIRGEGIGDDECVLNTARVSGVPDYSAIGGQDNQPCLPDNSPNDGRLEDDTDCQALVCVRPPSECTCTKATFTIWNMNEVKFSGTHRCICDWDQELISLYDAPNHMLRQYLQTNKGKARIDAIASPIVCDPFLEDAVSVDSPLLGVAAKQLTFHRPSPGVDADGIVKRDSAGMSLVGLGQQAGKITYALPTSGGPEERAAADNGIAVSRLLDGPQRLVRGSKIEPAESPLAGTTSASRLAS
ncbi:MAG: hypothetical protein J5J06_04105, partial [Phycisphaerae bacterium]|nr:hypothetical protein [Phycisphaerae bacterium]